MELKEEIKQVFLINRDVLFTQQFPMRLNSIKLIIEKNMK